MVHWLERDLAQYLAVDRPVYGLSLGFAGGDISDETLLPNSIRDIATHYIEEMRTLQPNGPYQLIGHSAGGLLAYEMALQILAVGQEVSLLGLLDTSVPQRGSDRVLLPIHLQLANVLKTPLSLIWHVTKKKIRQQLNRMSSGDRNSVQALRTSAAHRLMFIERALDDYEPVPCPGQIHLFKSIGEARFIRALPPPPIELAWANLAKGGVVVHELPGDHMAIVKKPLAKVTAAAILACLQPPLPARRENGDLRGP